MSTFKPIGDNIVGELIDRYGQRQLSSGIVLAERNGDASSIRPRWFRVTHKGPDAFEEIQPGQYVLVKHGRWSRKFIIDDKELFKIEPISILGISDTAPSEQDIPLPGE